MMALHCNFEPFSSDGFRREISAWATPTRAISMVAAIAMMTFVRVDARLRLLFVMGSV